MKLYTSYWAQVRNFSQNLIGLNATIWPPKWRPLGRDSRGVLVIDCPPLKPGKQCDGLCNGKCDPKHPQDCKFLQEYRKQLDAIDFTVFMRKINKLHDIIQEQEKINNVDFAFVFFEKYDNPCSERWTVQDWLQAHGVQVEEWHK